MRRRRPHATPPACPSCGRLCGYEPDQCAVLTRIEEQRARLGRPCRAPGHPLYHRDPRNQET